MKQQALHFLLVGIHFLYIEESCTNSDFCALNSLKFLLSETLTHISASVMKGEVIFLLHLRMVKWKLISSSAERNSPYFWRYQLIWKADNLSSQHLTIYLLIVLGRKVVLSWRVIQHAGESRCGGEFIKMNKSIAKGWKSLCGKGNLIFAMCGYDSRALDDMQGVTSYFCLNITQTPSCIPFVGKKANLISVPNP